VVAAVAKLVESAQGIGRAYNITQDETVTIDEFLHILGDILGVEPHIARFRRSELEAAGFLPDCSPFSERWMSELDNTRSKSELNISYTALPAYLEKLAEYYLSRKPLRPVSYKRRRAEIQMVEMARG
jgi:nucleoside-diphosphate-sugar epimerase